MSSYRTGKNVLRNRRSTDGQLSTAKRLLLLLAYLVSGIAIGVLLAGGIV